MPDSKITTSARISKATMKEYRKWAAATNRGVGDMLNIALLFALDHKTEVEREVSERNSSSLEKLQEAK